MPTLTGSMLHFAYGEDLAHAEFKRGCAGAEWFGPARLEDHRLIFNEAGRANVREEAGATVWGALWLVPASSLVELDATAATGGYVRTTRRIVSPAGPRTEATLYLAEQPCGEGAPAPGLTERLVEAAVENRLPAAYREELKAWAKAGPKAAETGGGGAKKTGKDSR